MKRTLWNNDIQIKEFQYIIVAPDDSDRQGEVRECIPLMPSGSWLRQINQ